MAGIILFLSPAVPNRINATQIFLSVAVQRLLLPDATFAGGHLACHGSKTILKCKIIPWDRSHPHR